MPKTSRIRPEERTRMTLSMSESDKILVQMYAAKHQTSVSDLLHDWIQLHCAPEVGNGESKWDEMKRDM